MAAPHAPFTTRRGKANAALIANSPAMESGPE
jgi:hypothetical protein